MITNDDDSDVYSLFSDAVYGNGLLDTSQTLSGDMDAVNESFDSAAFLSNSISDDIANYNFLEPLMPVSMLDDGGASEPESQVCLD